MVGKAFLLKELKKGKSLRTIAKETKSSLASIRYWKNKYEIDLSTILYTKKCKSCGKFLRGQQKDYCSFTCKNRTLAKSPKAKESQNKRGLKRKLFLVNLLGGKCSKCGYNRNISALCFHHKKNKKFPLDMRHLSNNTMKEILKEVNKCILLCNNCHAELHNPRFNGMLKKK